MCDLGYFDQKVLQIRQIPFTKIKADSKFTKIPKFFLENCLHFSKTQKNISKIKLEKSKSTTKINFIKIGTVI